MIYRSFYRRGWFGFRCSYDCGHRFWLEPPYAKPVQIAWCKRCGKHVGVIVLWFEDAPE